MIAGILRRQLRRAAQLAERIVNLALVQQDFPQRAVPGGILGRDPNRRPERADGFGHHLLLHICRSQIVGCGKIAGIELQRSLKGLNRTVKVP
jgi:hypothetical protein